MFIKGWWRQTMKRSCIVAETKILRERMLVVYKYTELLLSSRLALFEVAVVTALFAPVRSNNLKLLNPRGSRALLR